MEYIYAALLLHKLGKPVNEENLKKVIVAAGIEVDETKLRSLVASLQNVDIAKELETASVATSAVAASDEAKPAEKKEEEVKPEEAAEGLSALFG